MIIEGSSVFSNADFFEEDLHKVGHSNFGTKIYNEKKSRGRSVGSKDMTNEANDYKERKGYYF